MLRHSYIFWRATYSPAGQEQNMKYFYLYSYIVAAAAGFVTLVIEPTQFTKWLLFFALSNIAYLNYDLIKVKAFIGLKG